ncbi:MAG: T9SS type A sorting domain-containing protein [Bacteroidia bacterium]|nr:T9SS type A sorting domain-containing protein [Bacteroidia bacterium]
MKMNRLALFVCALMFGNIQAQSISCSNFTVKYFGLDTVKATTMQMGIDFQANTDQMVDYPHVTLITDCNGDTVAVGQMYYFGQFGGTTQDYPVTLLKSNYCEPLKVTFVYSNGGKTDTCYFFFGKSANKKEVSQNLFEVFPNPSTGKLTVKFKNHASNHELEIFDFLGRKVFFSIVSEDIAVLDLHRLPSGQYVLKADGKSQVLVLE